MSVGVPNRRERVTDEKGVTEEWQYGRGDHVYRRVYFSAQKLIRIRETDR